MLLVSVCHFTLDARSNRLWHKEKDYRDKNQQAQNKQTLEKHSDQLFFPKGGDRNAKKAEKHKDKTQGKTKYKSPRRINNIAT